MNRILLITSFLVLPQLLTAQSVNDPNYKDPGTAQLWGIVVTGGGHIYSGETGTGLLLLGTAIAGPVAGILLSDTAIDCSGLSCDNTDYTPYFIGIGVAVGAWIYSIIDSPKAAKRSNRKNGLASNLQVYPTIVNNRMSGYDPGIGLKIKF